MEQHYVSSAPGLFNIWQKGEGGNGSWQLVLGDNGSPLEFSTLSLANLYRDEHFPQQGVTSLHPKCNIRKVSSV